MAADDTLYCERCEHPVEHADATRTETMADLDPAKWQTLCCPSCGRRLKTVFVGREE